MLHASWLSISLAEQEFQVVLDGEDHAVLLVVSKPLPAQQQVAVNIQTHGCCFLELRQSSALTGKSGSSQHFE